HKKAQKPQKGTRSLLRLLCFFVATSSLPGNQEHIVVRPDVPGLHGLDRLLHRGEDIRSAHTTASATNAPAGAAACGANERARGVKRESGDVVIEVRP